jgi:hypothetical protein
MENYKILNPEPAVSWLFLWASSVLGLGEVGKRLCIFDRLSSFPSLGVAHGAARLAEFRGTIIAGYTRIG